MNGKRDRKQPETASSAVASTDDPESLARRVERLSRENAALFERLLADEKRFRGLARSVWRVQEAERRRLAAELHDGLGQSLTALKIRIERLAQGAAAGGSRAADAAVLASSLADVAAAVGEALADTRRLSHLLRPQVLDDLGLVAALRWLARTVAEATGFAVRLGHSGLDDERLGSDEETMLFRVVQEAITNSVKHSGAPGARVDLRRRGARVSLRVRDRGAGFDVDRAGTDGCGLGSMRDRVELCGGVFRLESAPGRGTTVRVELPLSRPAGEVP